MTSLSHSATANLLACARKYMLTYEWGMSRKVTTPGRRRGSAFAEALERWDVGHVDTYYQPILTGVTEQTFADDLTKERETVRILAEGYMLRYPKPSMVEVPFAEVIHDDQGRPTEYWNRGYIDAVDMRDGKQIVIENKLMSMWTFAQEQALQLDAQCTRYLHAARTLLGIPATHVEYRVTKWPGIRQKRGESIPEYLDRLRGEVRAEIDGAADKYYLSFDVFRTDNQLQDHQESLAAITNLVDFYRKQGVWPLNPGPACAMYGGCDFLPLCSDQPGAKELFDIKPRKKVSGA